MSTVYIHCVIDQKQKLIVKTKDKKVVNETVKMVI